LSTPLQAGVKPQFQHSVAINSKVTRLLVFAAAAAAKLRIFYVSSDVIADIITSELLHA